MCKNNTSANQNQGQNDFQINAERNTRFAEPVFRTKSGTAPTDMETAKLKNTKDRIGQVLVSAKQHDTFGIRLKNYLKQIKDRSSWFTSHTVPAQKNIGDEINKATATFGIKAMSESQKTKRGEKFRQKA